MDRRSWVAKKLSFAITDLTEKLSAVLSDNDVTFELECECSSLLSGSNISRIISQLDTAKGMCDFFAANPSMFSLALYEEMKQDFVNVAKDVTSITEEIEILRVVRTKMVSGASHIFNEMFTQLKFISCTLLSVASGNFHAVCLLNQKTQNESIAYAEPIAA